MKLLLNVGLARNDGRPDNTILRTVVVLNQCGFLIRQASIQQSDTEPTLVAEVRTERSPESAEFGLWSCAVVLGQDCIAAAQPVFDGGALVGSLHGPGAAKWGAFNPDLFLTLDAKEYA